LKREVIGNMIKLQTNAFGTFALKDSKIIEKILFPRENLVEIAKRLRKIEFSFCDEESELIKLLERKGIKELFVKNPERFQDLNVGIKFMEYKDKLKGEENIFNIGEQIGLSKEEIIKFLRNVEIELTKLKLKERSWDRILIQSINTLNDLEDATNILMEHLREWYSLNFPELEKIVKNPKLYAVSILGTDKIKGINLDESLRKKIEERKKKSFGMEFYENDKEIVNKFALCFLKLYETKEEIEKYIEDIMKENAPNITALVGPLLGARLISLAGSLKKLALMPSSTIQILGAENAFFKFLKTKKNPPKHGIIFQLPEIRTANKKIRGKLSRTLAGKLSIAAKADYYKGNFIGDKLREEFLRRVNTLKLGEKGK